MCGLLALLFIVVPAVEILVLIEVGSRLGSVPTLAVLIVTGVVGAALARHQGMAAVRALRRSLAEVREVGTSVVEAVLVLVAGVLMLTPGFMTDAVGLALLVPPVRRRVARVIAARYAARAAMHIVVGPIGGAGYRRDDDRADPPPPGIIDV